ncbi:MAG: peptide chain release factor 2 [bacterium]|nr:peptide chain release factor 2 [Bacillota bacterium]HHW55636.1 peptide chain release factor 2 [Bacillota bacterium]
MPVILYEELDRQLQDLQEKLTEVRDSLDIAGKEARIAALEEESARPGFWDDPAAAQEVMQELTRHKNQVQTFRQLEKELEELEVLAQLGEEEGDQETLVEVASALEGLQAQVEKMELAALLHEEYDGHNAILTLHAGAGGTEAQDWVEILLRMYTRWAEDNGFQVEVLDLLPGEEAGVKSATILVSGDNAYGYLKGEMGVHRLVRISPFDASGRRHTSFAAVEVMPEVKDDDLEVEINPQDLRIDTFRASGAGGQHVNKTDSAVRITHLPTGIVVSCQGERSQHANRMTAMKILQARLFERERRARESELDQLRGEQQEIAWGSQIRSYVFQPYKLVKDHRTGVEVGNAEGVVDGNLDPFIYAYLRQNAKG